jgi:putative spermidine/putrescine transport system ATP-binding protein
MSYLRLAGLAKYYAGLPAVAEMTLDVARGEMVVLLGPSGCGKTTTLRMVAGFVQADHGSIVLDGEDIGKLPPYRREMGIVFQSYALFPHLSVARNVAFGLEMRHQSRREIAARVAEMLRLVKLDRMAERLPRQLSGGQQQRVALARALAIHPKVLLLDEPLSNLDAALRQEVGREIRILQRDNGLTAVMVTHDQDEAMAMADRLVVMQEGRVQQIGAQEDLYERPATPFVARFIGRSNMVEGRLADPGTLLLSDGTRIALAGRYGVSGNATLALRPERLSLAAAGETEPGLHGVVEGRVALSTYLGAAVEHLVTVAPETQLILRGISAGSGHVRLFPAGAAVTVQWSVAGERLFDAEGKPASPLGAAAQTTKPGSRVTSHA